MENLTIDTGVKQLMVNGDPNKVITFNPMDTVFAEGFYQLAKLIRATFAEGDRLEREAAADKSTDADGDPAFIPVIFAQTRQMCEEMRQKVDDLFGAGTMVSIFGDVLYPEMFIRFLEGITPLVAVARSEMVSKYALAEKDPRKRHVMK